MTSIQQENESPLYITPQMFGAKADGKTDDTKAIQDALDASQSIFFPVGVYKISSTLTIHRNSHVCGIPAASKIRAMDNFSGKFMAVITDDPSSFLIENIEIDCNNVQGVSGLFLFRPYNRCVIRDTCISKCGGMVLMVGDTTEGRGTRETRSQTLVIDNCLFTGSTMIPQTSPLVYLYNSYELNLLNTKFLFSSSNLDSKPCLLLDRCYDAYVRGCSFAHTTGHAVEITGGTRYFRFSSNTYENVGSTSDCCIYCHGEPGSLIANGNFVERIYYNVSKNIKLEYATKIMVVGDFILKADKSNAYANSVISFDGSDTSDNTLIGFNGKDLNVGGDLVLTKPGSAITLKDSKSNSYSLKVGTDGNLKIQGRSTGITKDGGISISYNLPGKSSCIITHSDIIMVFTDRGGMWVESASGRMLTTVASSKDIKVARSSKTTLTVTSTSSSTTKICIVGPGNISIK